MKLRTNSDYTGDVENFPPTGNVTPENLAKLFYIGDREGGGKELFWKNPRGWKVKAGTPAGTIHLKANIVQINGVALYCHDVAYILQTGKFPEGEVIHLDGDSANHDIGNLHIVPNKTRS